MRIHRNISRRKFFTRARAPGIALFILLTSLIVLSLLMKELMQTSSTQANRVRNAADRIEALYLAKTATNLARLFIFFDGFMDKQAKDGASDTLTDIWTQPVPFPVPVKEIRSFLKEMSGENDEGNSEEDSATQEDILKKCDDFFADFGGDATAKTTDLASLLYLNYMNDNDDPKHDNFETLQNLLTPNDDFRRSLAARNINPETVARQIRDYADSDDVENETKSLEKLEYTSLQLDYEPKNRLFTNMDELKLIPLMDDELFDYLSHYVTGFWNAPGMPHRKRPGMINLNTVKKDLFQALLKVPNGEDLAERFIKDRKEKKTIYTDAGLKQALKDKFDLDADKIRINLLTGASDAFKIETDATVNQVQIRLETYAPRTPGQNKVEPPALIRLSP
jgi:type II secretory pathway component PulK